MEVESQLTGRAIITGLSIGLLLCSVNTYFGLQSGWISMMSLQASLLGFAIFKTLPIIFSSFTFRPLTIHENVLIQTIAVASGTLPLAAGFVGLIPALGQLNMKDDNVEPLILSFFQCIAWASAVAFFGVFLAIPLREQIILKEKMTFPSGTATAQVIAVLHEKPIEGKGTRRRRGGEEGEYQPIPDVEEDGKKVKVGGSEWRYLGLSFTISAFSTLLSLAFPVIYAIPIFDLFYSGLAHDALFWFSPSFSYIGQGIIMGPSTVIAMNIGMLLGWAILAPISKVHGWAENTGSGGRDWILWTALAILLSESIVSLITVATSTMFSKIDRTRKDDSDEEEDETEEDQNDIPSNRIVIGGIILSSILCVILIRYIFGSQGIQSWAVLVALLLGSLLAILGVRALGETDLNPVSAIGKISQLIFAVVQPHNPIANLIAGGISEAGANQAGDLCQDLKTGHLLGSSTKAQFYGQLIGSLASVFFSSGIYILYRSVYEFPSNAFPVPSAAIWLNLTRLLNNGHLPPKAKESMLIFGPLFLLLAGMKQMSASNRRTNSNWVKYIPSGIAVGVGFINTPSFSLARLIGGLISLYFTSKTTNPSNSSTPSHLRNIPLIIIASGFVLGEGFAAIIGLAIKSAGGEALSCSGCNLGGGGYCSGCP